MSQYGAYGLALDGWSAPRIVTHYYSGTRVGPEPKRPDRLRVGLVQGRKVLHLEARGGKVELHLGQANGGDLVATIPDGSTWTIEISGGQYAIRNGKGKVVGSPIGGPSRDLFARYAPLGSQVHLAEAGHSYGRGWVELNIYPKGCDGCTQHLRAVADVPPEEYLYGLAEVPSSWPAQALRAQAIAARTYAVEKVLRVGQHRTGCNCGLYASTFDQVYIGWDKEVAQDGGRWVSAVNATAGKVVLYHGKLVQAYYHSSSGGFTEDNENVWAGAALPYLRGVCDPGDYVPANPNRVWEESFTGRAMGADLAGAGHDVGAVKRFTGVTRGVSGRIVSITVVGARGRVTLSGPDFRSALGLRDDRVWIDSNRNVVGDVRALYDRLDCAPGLPQSPRVKVDGGARQRFADGAIYRNDAAGATVWLHGPVHDKYVALGEDASVLGLPRTGVATLAKLHGRVAQFAGGSIYFRVGAGAHELHGRILDYFLSHGGAWKLGFPTTDVVKEGGGTVSAAFDSGVRVTCRPGKACRKSKA